MIENIKRRLHLGIYSKLGKIEELIKQYATVDFCYMNGHVSVKHLKPEWQEALKQFGYSKDAVIFGVNYRNNNVSWPLCCISPGPSKNKDKEVDYLKLLHEDCPGDYCWHWDDDGKIEEGVEECYVKLQKFFMFMTIYLKQREAMERLIKIEWDGVKTQFEE